MGEPAGNCAILPRNSDGAILTAAPRDRLQGQADALRNLVRIKVADDNDLKAANLALQTCSDFFGGLTLAAAAQGIGDFDLLKTL